MGMTPLVTDIFLKGSDSYLNSSPCSRHSRAIPGNGTRNPVTLRLGFVWLFWCVAVCGGADVGARRNSYFSNCCISSIIGVLNQNY